MIWREILSSFIGTAAVMGVLIIALKYLGSHFIELQIAKALEDYRQRHAADLELLRGTIIRLSDVVSRRNEKEFEIVHEAWSLMTKATGISQGIFSARRQTLDFEGMEDDQAEAVIESLPFAEFQKRRLRSANPKERNKIYSDTRFWHDQGTANDAVNNFINYLNINRIFIAPDLRNAMRAVGDDLRSALVSREIRRDEPGKHHYATAAIVFALNTRLDEIEIQIQRRFHVIPTEDSSASLPPLAAIEKQVSKKS